MTDAVFPLIQNAAMVDRDAVAAYLRMLFEHVEWGQQALGVRGVGEKGTAKEGRFTEPKWYLPEHVDLLDGDKRSPMADILRWSQWHVAAYIVPAVLHPSSIHDEAVELKHIALFTTLVVDYDSGDTGARLAYAEERLGRASMVVFSGGITPDGHPKRHAYWRLSEPTDEIDRVAELRKTLAIKTGGDPSFGRAPQIIRIAGSVHAKDGISNPVRIERTADTFVDLEEAADRISEMQPMPGLPAAQGQAQPGGLTLPLDFGAGAKAVNGLDFSAGAPSKPAMADVLTTDVHEGGTEEQNRWSEFSRVAGWEIHLVRQGHVTLQQAIDNVRTWVMLHMKPAWPDARIRVEFNKILNLNIQQNGALPEEVEPAADIALPGTIRTSIVAKPGLAHWDIGAWAMGSAPAQRFLVDKLIMADAPHMLAADGGVGKTFLALDLCLRLAASGNSDRPLRWMGEEVTNEAAGGTVIMLTAEDGIGELHRRLERIDPDRELRTAAAGRFRLVPLVNDGGAFPLVAYDARRQPQQSPRWARMYNDIAEIVRGGGRVSAVVIDTMASTLHGEDISGAVVSEYAAELARLSGELGCATIVTHHTRKTSADAPIKNLEDMRAAFRGSGAVTNSVRAAIGVWHASDWNRRLRAMGERPERGRLYMAGIVKANSDGLLSDTKTLLRSHTGLLEDATGRDRHHDLVVLNQEYLAWLIVAAREAALARYPLAKTGSNGLFRRRAELPPALHTCTRAELEAMCQHALDRKLLVAGGLATSRGGHRGYIDVPDGPIPRKQGHVEPGAWKPDWSMFVYDLEAGDVVVNPDRL